MPTITMTDDQANILVESLKSQRGLLMKDWGSAFSGVGLGSLDRDCVCDAIEAEMLKVVDVRKLVEDAVEVQKGLKTRRQVAAEHGIDVEQVDADNARDKERITESDARRRQAVAEMIIAEVQAAKAFRKCAGLDPEGTPHGGSYPPAEIAAYLELGEADAEESQTVRFSINGQDRTFAVSKDVADQLAQFARRT